MAKQKFITKILLQNGFTQDELKAMDQNQKNEIYSRGIKRFVEGFSYKPKEVIVHKAENPFVNLEKLEDVYNLSVDFFKYMSVDDVVILLHKRFRLISIDKIQKIVKLLMYSFQENILGEIERKISSIPDEERHCIMDIYERQKEDISHIISINEKLDQEKFRKKFEEVLEIKMLVQKYKDKLKDEGDEEDES